MCKRPEAVLATLVVALCALAGVGAKPASAFARAAPAAQADRQGTSLTTVIGPRSISSANSSGPGDGDSGSSGNGNPGSGGHPPETTYPPGTGGSCYDGDALKRPESAKHDCPGGTYPGCYDGDALNRPESAKHDCYWPPYPWGPDDARSVQED